MKNENAIMDRIKARIAYHANEHRHTYEIGKGVMDFLARDLLADFKAAGGLLPRASRKYKGELPDVPVTENDIGRSVFLTLEEAEKAVV